MRFVFVFVVLLAQLLGASFARAQQPVYAPVTPGSELSFPRDYGAHPEFRTEWWYVTGWVDTPDKRALGFQVTFFRSRTGADTGNPSAFAPRQLVIAHAALSDPAVGRLVHDQRSAREGFGLAWARPGNTDLKLDDWRMVRDASGTYRVTIRSNELTLELRLKPTQPVLVQGQGGYSRKGPSPQLASYYYSEPHLGVSGSVGRAGMAPVAVTGSAWLDHEWSSEVLQPDAAGWDWVGANLDDGGALMAFRIRSKGGDKLWGHATVRDAAGRVTHHGPEAVDFTPHTQWKSPRTGATYPVGATISTGAQRWRIVPLQPDQELDSRRSTGAVYWEGAVTVEQGGRRVGRGYLEMTGYVQAMKL
ncbi:carotenoid 1,2-hydratase [Massilia sp. YIM B02443]|uniref:lipocalin-like domain-containing protein n=1 Tax=Massilia sp. YIM B02443 TaxID=3050127 RepID=UPI0025B63BE3|nr:carotenoid 1,2-hydratase [Massilia sp. YIM B02443]MDN4039881.1 carotenoid 1,2-hydratase [Massilia sp. YIM B02443]